MKCPASATRTVERATTFATTLSGKRKALMGREARRAWDMTVPAARPADVASIDTLVRSNAPAVWVPPEAANGNLITQQSAAFSIMPSTAADAGLVGLPNGQIAKSVVPTSHLSVTVGPGARREHIPVLQGVPVTLGAWATGEFRISGIWLDIDGNSIVSFGGTKWTGLVGWQWREETFTPPSNAVSFTFNLNNGTQYAAPSASWGAKAAQQAGNGCTSAVVHSASFDPLVLNGSTNITSMSYTVTEVG